MATMSDSTVATYRRAYALLTEFKRRIFPDAQIWPATEATVTTFISFLHQKSLAASTILTYVSAIGTLHKYAGLSDPTSSFLVRKTLYGLQKLKSRRDIRLPITFSILSKLMQQINRSQLSAFNKTLFAAMFQIAFHGFLRIGEIVLRNSAQQATTILQAQNTTFYMLNDTVSSVQITLINWKHNYSNQPTNIIIKGKPNSEFCPCQSLVQYFRLRGFTNGPLFKTEDGSPCNRNFFNATLKGLLRDAGLDYEHIKGHSFRIGAATTAAIKGVSETEIQRLGRWKSKAYNRYIRIPDLKMP